MLISLKTFRGERPRVDPKLLANEEAVLAQNCKLWHGDLRPFRSLLTHETPTKVGTKLSIYRFAPTPGDIESGFFFHWTTDVDCVRGPIRGDTAERTYFTGDGVPKYTDSAIATSGGTDYPENDFDLGLPAPSGSVTVTPQGPAGEAEDLQKRSYAITFVTTRGEEGPPLFTSEVDWYPTRTSIDLSNIPTAPGGDYDLGAGATKRIYRTATALDDTEYYFVAEIAIATTVYSDTKADDELGEVLLSTTWSAPPSDMKGLEILPNGIAYGISKNEVYFSEAYLPHAWNPLNAYGANYPFVGCKHVQNTVVAVTEKSPHLITGINPNAMDGHELNVAHGCASKRSMVSGRWGVGYASPDGYVVIGQGGSVEVITDEFYTEDGWDALVPTSMLGCEFNNRILLFYDTGAATAGIIFDPQRRDLVRTTVHATAAYSDRLAKSLFLQVGADIVRWDEGGSDLTYTWRSKEFVTGRPTALTVARVLAANYTSLTFKLYADGVLVHTESVSNGKPFRMPRDYAAGKARAFQFELTGTSPVKQVDIAENVSELPLL